MTESAMNATQNEGSPAALIPSAPSRLSFSMSGPAPLNPAFFQYEPSWFTANTRVIEPGPTCGPGRPRMFGIRFAPAGTMVKVYGDPATREAFSQVCVCGKTPCTYFDDSTTAPMPQAARLEVRRAAQEAKEADEASQKYRPAPPK